MGVFIRRPNPSTSTGNGSTARNRITDGSDGTIENESSSTPYLWNYNSFSIASIPAGRKVIAVRAAHRIRQSGSYNGWPEAWIRYSGARVAGSRLHDPSISSSALYSQFGPAVYKADYTDFSEAEVNNVTSETARFVYQSKGWYSIADHWQEVVYSEALTSPTVPFPANAAVVATSTVGFSVQLPAPQSEQYVRGIFQVARDNTFTTDARTFSGQLHNRTGGTERATYTSVKGTASDTDLGPGLWYYRYKAQDIIGTETAWSATISFTVTHAALPVPSLTSPVPDATSATPYGVRSAAIVDTPTDGRAVGVQWDFSPVSDFSSGVVTWTNSTQNLLSAPGTIAYNAQPNPATTAGQNGATVAPGDPSQYLAQGIWYARVRTKDKWGQYSSYSSTASFTVDHKPVAQGVTPASNKVIDQTVTPIRWTFGDPWTADSQTAYQIRVYNSANTLIYDSGKIASTTNQHTLALSGTYLYETLRYTINLYDLDDKTPTSVASNYFVFSNSPAINMTFPAEDEEVLTGQPTFTWNPGIGRPGTSQASYELKIYNRDTNQLIHSSGVSTVPVTSYTPSQVVLRNSGNYYLTLRIVDTDGLNSTLVRNFTTNYQAPADPVYTVDPESYETNGYVLIDWSLTSPDGFFATWNVYRRPSGSLDWELVASIEDVSVREYRDWLVPSQGTYEYVVTQIAERSGFRLESNLPEAPSAYLVQATSYWLIMPNELDYGLNVRLHVYGDTFTDELEEHEFVVAGRGRKVNYGTRLGISGTLSAKLRPRSGLTAGQQRAALRVVREQMSWVWLRDPFGGVTRVALGNPSYTRVAGVGFDDFADVEIPVKEVG
jgi:hypothetical protein